MEAVLLGKVVNVQGEGDVFAPDEGGHFPDFSPWHGRRVLVVDLGPAEGGKDDDAHAEGGR